jgi:heme oxygenase
MIGQTNLLSPIIEQNQAGQSLRSLLRQTTQDVHDRLHRHVGFAAIQDTTIGLEDYRSIIIRLYGFYVPFEAAASIQPERSKWLADDLKALGLKSAFTVLPMCQDVPCLDSSYLRLGARYVAEGSALGGRELARGLDHLFGKDVIKGRQFFIGRGAGTGEAWAHYLTELSAAPPDPSARSEIIKGAVETFAAFENWLSGWSTLPHGRL